MSEQIIYQVTVSFEQGQASDTHYQEFKDEVKSSLTSMLPASKGTSEAQIVSVEEV